MRRVALTALLGWVCLAAHAEEACSSQCIEFQSSASRQVENDLLLATLSLRLDAPTPAEVARKLNTGLNGALRLAAGYAGVRLRSGNQQTQPVYGKNDRIVGWRGQAELQLESRDFKSAAELIGRLQDSLQLTRLGFALAPETQRSQENQVIQDALAAFRERAETIRKSLGASDYRVVRLSVQQGGQPGYPMLAMRAKAMDDSMPTPDFAAGDSQMSITVNGVIELLPRKP